MVVCPEAGRRTRRPWSEEEIAHLMRGLEIFRGEKMLWRKIQRRFFAGGSRTNVDLKDKARNLRISPSSRPRMRWTPEEDARLRAGIKLSGGRCWAKIKSELFAHSSRTNIDIKDRVRNEPRLHTHETP